MPLGSTPAARPEAMTRQQLMALVAEDLARVEKAIGLDTICSVEAVTEISRHLQLSGGKRLRPLLVLLCARATGDRGEAAIHLGAVTEIVHTATLIHDDVIDEAATRRGRPSINQRWGNQTSVLAGDWLYMRAFAIALRERNFRVLDLLIELTQTMVEGELLQKEILGRVDLSESEHLELIHRKTASLFSVCARFGSLVGGADRALEDRFGDYGWNLGMAFQLIDDVLDFSATEETLGKPVGADLREGKVTLPLILALERCTEAERAIVRTVVEEGDYRSVPFGEVLELLRSYGAIEEVRRRAAAYTAAAVAKLQPLPETPFKRALLTIPDWITDRQS